MFFKAIIESKRSPHTHARVLIKRK